MAIGVVFSLTASILVSRFVISPVVLMLALDRRQPADCVFVAPASRKSCRQGIQGSSVLVLVPSSFVLCKRPLSQAGTGYPRCE